MSSAAKMYSEAKRKLESLEEMQKAHSEFPPDTIYLNDRIIEWASKVGSVAPASWGSAGKGFLAGVLFSIWSISSSDRPPETIYQFVVSLILFLILS